VVEKLFLRHQISLVVPSSLSDCITKFFHTTVHPAFADVCEVCKRPIALQHVTVWNSLSILCLLPPQSTSKPLAQVRAVAVSDGRVHQQLSHSMADMLGKRKMQSWSLRRAAMSNHMFRLCNLGAPYRPCRQPVKAPLRVSAALVVYLCKIASGHNINAQHVCTDYITKRLT
jgi:hypothetical protein